jgi:hypothetical protein
MSLFPIVFVCAAVVMVAFIISNRNDEKLAKRWNDHAWKIAVYGDDDEFSQEIKYWRAGSKKRCFSKEALRDIRRRRNELRQLDIRLGGSLSQTRS